jgi:inner membrane transporter RhtA
VEGLTGEKPGELRLPLATYFVTSAVFHSLGPSFAVLLFDRLPVGAVAWLRITSAAAVFALWRRPWRALPRLAREQRGLVAILGVLLAAMNYSYYRAIDTLPLGTVAALEFVGPVLLAAAGVRSVRNGVAFAATVAGVAFLLDVHLAVEPVGLGFAAANSTLFAGYVVVGHRVAAASGGTEAVDRLGLAMLAAAVVVTPVGAPGALSASGDLQLLAAGVVVGVTSSVIPYVLDQRAMARVGRSTFALFLSLLPATAVVIGFVVLDQRPQVAELAGVALIAAGVATHRAAAPAPSPERSTVDA